MCTLLIPVDFEISIYCNNYWIFFNSFQALPAQSTAPSSKTFACPTKSGQSLTVTARKAVARHDPNAPGAIVLEVGAVYPACF